MAKFDAATAIEPMEVDFSKYGGPVGELPEPTGKQVDVFMDNLKAYRKKRALLIREGEKVQEEGDDEKIDAYLESIPEEELKAETAEFFGWVEAVTSGYLQADMLSELPPRLWSKFLAWFVGELTPKAKD